ncbi:hypothetical protein HY408_00345 [Candidatus Gottesmanbacteria bacterium]|nr:hypothetical protein [Candidatus Gottesmanbacteria bacterium]
MPPKTDSSTDSPFSFSYPETPSTPPTNTSSSPASNIPTSPLPVPPAQTQPVNPPATPPPPPPIETTLMAPPASSKPPKKSRKKLAFTMTAIAILVIGLIASLIMVKQSQDTRQFASGNWCNPDPVGTIYGVCEPPGATDCGGDGKATVCGDDYRWHATGACCIQPTPPPPGDQCGVKCAIHECPQGCTVYNDCCPDGSHNISDSCPTGSGTTTCALPECRDPDPEFVDCAGAQSSGCGQVDRLDSGNQYCGVQGTQCANGTNACETTPNPSPSTSPEPTPSCERIKAYKVNDQGVWTRLNQSAMNALTPGEIIRITVSGTHGNLTKGRIRVRLKTASHPNPAWPQFDVTTLTKDDSSPKEFYIEYDISTFTEDTTFEFQGEVYDKDQNKWY